MTPGFKQPEVVWSKEIGVLQALASTPTAIRSEKDLQSLVHEITSVVEEAKSKKSKTGAGKGTELTDSTIKSIPEEVYCEL
jgi:hypothetical protein